MTEGPRPGRVVIEAPAKLNLGLEIVGRRPDGYHDLVTIFQAIDLRDRLTLTATLDGGVTSGLANIPDAENLAVLAATALRRRFGIASGAQIDIVKRIPSASGLGGASSDAAASLLGGRVLWGAPASDADLRDLAADVGSDVPFFLQGGTALAEGRGDRLEPLPAPPDVNFVVVSPRITIQLRRKTATLYSALEPGDFSSGDRVRQQAGRLRSGRPLEPGLLVNAFARPLAMVIPALAHLPDRLSRLGAPNVALSGAGPTHYVVLHDPEEARRLVRTIRADLGGSAVVGLHRLVAHPPLPLRT